MRVVALFAALLVALVTSCSGSGAQQKAALPDGTALLADAAKAMRAVTTTHFALEVQGNTSGIQLRSADGRLTRDGSAKGTAKVDEGRQLLELQFVIIGQELYIKPPTGRVQKLPLSFAGAVYDPSVILNPDRGIAAALASGTGATTEAREQVDNVDSYRLQVKFPAQPLGAIVPELAGDKISEIWVAAQGSRLVKAQFPTTYGTGTVHFSDFDAPVEITPPA
jgi:lipoprotein LprG